MKVPRSRAGGKEEQAKLTMNQRFPIIKSLAWRNKIKYLHKVKFTLSFGLGNILDK